MGAKGGEIELNCDGDCRETTIRPEWMQGMAGRSRVYSFVNKVDLKKRKKEAGLIAALGRRGAHPW